MPNEALQCLMRGSFMNRIRAAGLIAIVIFLGGFANKNVDQELIVASRENQLQEAQRLIAANADVNAVDESEKTALMAAASGENLEMVKILLAAGADVNAAGRGGNTALIEAAYRGKLEMVKALLAAGADVNAKKLNGKSALDYANSDEIKSLLLAAINGKI